MDFKLCRDDQCRCNLNGKKTEDLNIFYRLIKDNFNLGVSFLKQK